MKNDDTLFSVDTVAKYLYSLKYNISPVKLHKSLYFLFAYYGALYSSKFAEGEIEGIQSLPKYLFNSTIEAWKFGSVIREILGKEYGEEDIANAVSEVNGVPEVQQFIDDLFKEIDNCSDFTLIERNRNDEVWKQSYKNGQMSVLDADEIIKEYIARYI